MKKRILFYLAFSFIWTLVILFVPVRMETCLASPVYENRGVNLGEVYVRLYSSIGLSKKLDGEWFGYECTGDEKEKTIETSFLYLKDELRIKPIQIDRIDAVYAGRVCPGDMFREELFSAETVFENGRREEIGSCEFENAPYRFGTEDTRLWVDTPDGKIFALVKPVQITSVEADIQKELYQYDVPEFSNITVHYSDGGKMTLKKENVSFTKDIDRPLEQLGKQTLDFTFNGISYKIPVCTLENTNATNARREYKEETKSAVYTHTTKDLYAVVTEHYDHGGHYYLTHVVVNDPSQITGDLSYGDWGGVRECPSSAAQRLGLVVSANASYFSYKTNAPRCTDIIIKNGVSYGKREYSDGKTNGQEICLMEDGTLFTPPKGLTAYELIKLGVTDSWAAGDPLLIQNGMLLSTKHKWVFGKYPRTAIGMVKPCEYYLLTAGSVGYNGGLTFDDVQDIYDELGCVYARTLDGGGSSTLVFDDGDGPSVINAPAGGVERAVADIIGFSD